MPRTTPSLADRLRGLGKRLGSLVRPRETEHEMSAELAFHIDMETEQNVRRGMSPPDARVAAVRAFGGVGRVAEQVRETRKIGWLDDLILDLRHAARGFRRSPGFTLAAIAALSLGIGANAAVFSVVHAIVLAPLPYAEPDRLVHLWERNPAQRIERGSLSRGTFVDLRNRSRTLERVGLFNERDFLLTSEGKTWEAQVASVSPAVFEMLGVRAVLGTVFPPESDPWASGADQAVISHDLWQQRFGGDSSVLGRRIQFDMRFSYRIIGVMPPGFAFPAGTSIWTPMFQPSSATGDQRQIRFGSALGQLRRGYTVEQATQEAAAIAAQLASEYPASNAGWTLDVAPLDRAIVGDTRTILLVLLGLALCVLLVACGNVATLAVARATARRHETAVRVALGAGRRRLLRQWTAEGLLLALLGGAGGLLVGHWSTRFLLAVAPAGIPRLDEVRFSGAVLGFVMVVTVLAAILVGLAPALRVGETRPLDLMQGREGRTAVNTRTREWLLGAQVALTMMLTVAASLLLHSYEKLQATDLGYRRSDILSAEVRVPFGKFRNPEGAAVRTRHYEMVQFYTGMMAEVSALPGVLAVEGTSQVPLSAEPQSGTMWLADAAGARGRTPPTSAADQWNAATQIVTPGYFEAMGIPVVRGRHFDPGDRFTEQQFTSSQDNRPPGVAIINEAMARQVWPDADPIGQRLVIYNDMRSFAPSRTIVGVVRDVRSESVATTASPTVFLPFAQHPTTELSLVVRSDLPPGQLVKPVTDRLHAFDPAVTVVSAQPLDDVVASELSRPRFTLLLVGSFALLALVIAAVGVFGIVGFLVTQRTHEIGIRMALGARPRGVLLLVLREGLHPVLLGAAAGCAGAAAVAHGMRALLYGLAPLDALSFAAAASVLLAASVIAAIIPAGRAASLDPLRALRVE